MRITEYLSRRAIVPEMKATSKDEVLRELAQALASEHPEIDAEELVRVLEDRERLGSTGLKDGVAVPHGKMKAVRRLAIAVGRSPKGIDFGSMDQQPATLFFLLVAPEDAPGSHLQALGRIVDAAQDESFRRALARAKTDGEIHDVIRRAEERRAHG